MHPYEMEMTANSIVQAFVLTGSNLGNREDNISSALEGIGSIKDSKIIKISSVYETEAWGIKEQPAYLNQVIEIETSLQPHDLLNAILNIENSMGRERSEKWTARIIDIDLLFFGEAIIESDLLTVPHPQLHKRKFTLLPLAEIAGELIHPLFLKSVNELLHICSDTSEVKVYKRRNS